MRNSEYNYEICTVCSMLLANMFFVFIFLLQDVNNTQHHPRRSLLYCRSKCACSGRSVILPFSNTVTTHLRFNFRVYEFMLWTSTIYCSPRPNQFNSFQKHFICPPKGNSKHDMWEQAVNFIHTRSRISTQSPA